MITLRKLSAEVIRLESGGDPSNDSQLSQAYIVLLLRQALNTLLAPKIFEKLGQDDRSGLHLLIVTYTVDVVGENDNKYSDLPEFYHSMLFNDGLHIAPVEDPTNYFIQRHNPGVSRGLPCADLDPEQYSFWTVGKRVYYDETFDFPKVLMYLTVAAPDSVGIDDNLPIFPDMAIPAIQLVRQMLKDTPPQDKILDNNPDIGVKTR